MYFYTGHRGAGQLVNRHSRGRASERKKERERELSWHGEKEPPPLVSRLDRAERGTCSVCVALLGGERTRERKREVSAAAPHEGVSIGFRERTIVAEAA